ncbi:MULTISPECIES: TetR/AcrR family transcriptional regulator [Tsukamurella]|uniref:TetR/AcrR family transcriptional regulator n=2 Tax=Tsukamurella TaxID=2060 RepID=A0A5C5RY36_9ACTN|nr:MULTISPECIES: TetR/AcrR family transcriptional regulator [Tsukamurella]NMD58078.1 TetR/AcrR family transcriptional regulator [Tsukamurella columbiensis]TWS28017.1 TetR/AcrR family transcriptional regulator [Tsukamurella conjunctivitidis]
MTETEGRRYSGVSAEARRDERRARFVDAALTVAAREGVAAVSARSLCAESGLHARYFRETFDSPDQVLAEAFDAMAATVVADARTAIASVPEGGADGIERKVRAGVHGSLAAMSADPRRAALLMGADLHPGLRDRREALVDLLAGVMAGQAAELLDDPPDPVDARLSARLIVVGGIDLAIAARAGRIDASPERIEQIMVAGILGNRELTAVLRRLRGADG